MSRIIGILSFSFFIISCKSSDVKIKAYAKSLKLNTTFSINIKEKIKDYNVRMNEGFVVWYESVCFVHLTNKNKIAFIHILEDSSKQVNEVDIAAFLNKKSPYHSVVFKNNAIFSLDRENYKLYRIQIDANFLINKVDSFSFSSAAKGYELYTSVAQEFQVIDSVCYIPFYPKKNGNLEKFAYLKLNFRDTTSIIKVIRRPKEYSNDERYNGAYYLFKNAINQLAVFYTQTNKMNSYNSQDNQLVKETVFNEFEGFVPFEKSRQMDLAYITQYLEKNEYNEQVIALKDKFLIIKKLGRLNKREQLNYEYIGLDANFKTIYYNLFTVPILPQYAFPYKKGFVVLGVNAPNAYYYEVP